MKNVRFELRLSEQEKEKLFSDSKKRGCTPTEFIRAIIMDKIDFATKKKTFDFIDKDDYFYSKIENNINQVARIVNSEKQISESTLNEFNSLLHELVSISNEKGIITKRILEELIK